MGETFFPVLQTLTTCALCGLIWTIQLVHYPAFAFADGSRFSEFHRFHGKRITVLVGILMPVELVAAAVAAGREPGVVPLVGLGLVLLIWASTAALQIPAHRTLSEGFDDAAHRRLVRTNWIRTLAWTARAVLVTTAF